MKSLWCFLIAALSNFIVFGQTGKKTDVIFKTNGDQLKGDVVEITDSNISFKYSGEQAIYTFKKTEVQKIIFASGRTETFSNTTVINSNPATSVQDSVPATPSASPSSTPASADERRNKIAILPFSFIKDGQNLPQEVGDEVQNECYTLLSKNSGSYTVVSPRTTNVKLAKAGIDKSSMLKYTMTEICELLGVQYVVTGFITQNRTSQSQSTRKAYDFKSNNDKKANNDKMSGSSTSSSNVSDEYESVTNINIYNDKSENIYSQRRKALFSTVGAYKSTVSYLLKRSPLYTK